MEAPNDSQIIANNLDDDSKSLLNKERSYIFEARVQDSKLCRDKGNAFFKCQDIVNSMEFYKRALYHVHFDEAVWAFELLEEHKAAVNEVRLPVHLNLAACYLKEDHYDSNEAYEQCCLALKIDKVNPKALFRRSQAQIARGNLDEAKQDLKAAAEIKPNDIGIRKSLQELQGKLAEARMKEKNIWGGQFAVPQSSNGNTKEENKTHTVSKEAISSKNAKNETSPSYKPYYAGAVIAVFCAVGFSLIKLFPW